MMITLIGLVIAGMAVYYELTEEPHLTPDKTDNVTDITLRTAA